MKKIAKRQHSASRNRHPLNFNHMFSKLILISLAVVVVPRVTDVVEEEEQSLPLLPNLQPLVPSLQPSLLSVDLRALQVLS